MRVHKHTTMYYHITTIVNNYFEISLDSKLFILTRLREY